MPRIHLVSNLPGVNALGDHLRAAGLGPTSARSADALLVLIDRPLDHVEQELLDRARQSVPVLLAGPTVRALPPDSPLVEASGLVPGRATPPYELRLTAGPQGGALMARAADFRPREGWVIPDKVADDVERLILIRHEMGEHPVCTWRPATGLGMFTLGTGPAVLAEPAYHRLVGRWLRHCLGVLDAPPLRVGLLGTPDATAVHQAAVSVTEGLELAAVCDGGVTRSPSHAASRPPRRVDDPDDLVNDPELGVIVVATPTHTHLEWAGRALEAGKHVVVHAPLCLSTSDADQLAVLADTRSVVLAVYPAGQDDAGHRALRSAVRRGAVGEPLRLDGHVGGFRRPGGTWHDDERISGGQLHDRGTAGIDQILALVDDQIEWISASTMKRVWHHVSNADHSRVLIRFVGGAEAQLTVSDLAVGPRPRLEVLGTAGSLILDGPAGGAGADGMGEPAPRLGRHAGPWAETDETWSGAGGGTGPGFGGFGGFGSPQAAASGSLGSGPGAGGEWESLLLVTHDGARSQLPIALAPAAAFHRDLADCLVAGWPLADYGVDGARRVVAVLEAAKRSAAAGGVQIAPL